MNRPGEGEAWSSLWKIQATPKAKHLLWRICKDCLPARTQLRNRHVQYPVECPLCLLEPEEEWHIFFECEGNKEAWTTMDLNHVLQSRINSSQNTRALIFDICRYDNKQVAGKIAVLLWCIWQNRNNEVWNNSKLSAQQIGMQAANMWNEWATVQGLLEEQQTHEQQLTARTDQQWQ
ncbi:pentatricopeptide repeat-containing protein, partial [Trifolium medium]|nr:pentatricopeptide repeat-containing protein [Trifolium medium]